MMLIDLNKLLQEYVKVFGKENVSEHITKLLQKHKQGEKNATSKKKT